MQDIHSQTNESAASAVDLVKKASSDAADLVKAELALAREELGSDLVKLRGSAAALGIAGLLGVVGLELVLGAVVVSARRHPWGLAILGVGCLVGATVLGASAIASAPTVLGRTRRRVAEDASTIEEKMR